MQVMSVLKLNHLSTALKSFSLSFDFILFAFFVLSEYSFFSILISVSPKLIFPQLHVGGKANSKQVFTFFFNLIRTEVKMALISLSLPPPSFVPSCVLALPSLSVSAGLFLFFSLSKHICIFLINSRLLLSPFNYSVYHVLFSFHPTL